MSLTVANRIRLGFATILLILLIIGGNSFFNFMKVENEALHAQQVALPSLEASTQLEILLLIIQRLALEEYFSKNIEQLNKNHNEITQHQQKIDLLLQQLKTLARDDKNLSDKLPGLTDTTNDIRKTIEILYQSKKTLFLSQDNLAVSLNTFNVLGYDIASSLYDVVDIETDHPQAEGLIAVADQLDSLMITNMETVEDIAKQINKKRTNAVARESIYLNNDFEIKLDYLITRGKGIIDDETVERLKTDYDKFLVFLKGPKSIETIKLKILTTTDELEVLSNQTNSQTVQGVKKVQAVLQAATESAEHSELLILERVSSGKTQAIIAMIIASIVSIFVSYNTVRSIVRPLNKINRALGALAHGDLTQVVDHKTKDELGVLTKNINHLASSLRSVIASIASGSRQLATASEHTSSITQETTYAIGEQQTQIDQAAAAINEMSLSAGQVSEHAVATLQEVKETNNQAISVAKVSENNTQTITALSNDVSNASEVINKLHDDSTDIGSIIDVIRGIADQTNLLALNAAIEAARAGEQGRGFAVVADEVRNLANRTQQSTSQINDMVELIQSGAQQAVKVMDLSQKHAQSCVIDSEKTSSSLHAMSDALVRVEEKSSQISQAATEQNIVSLEISTLLESIVEISNNTSAGADKTEQATIEVANLAVELQTAAANFKI